MAQVVLKDINKFYDSVHAVKDVNLQIHDKEFVVFVGPVGLRQDHDAAHDRRAGGDQLRATSPSTARWSTTWPPMDRDIAMVFQNYALYPHMTSTTTWRSA